MRFSTYPKPAQITHTIDAFITNRLTEFNFKEATDFEVNGSKCSFDKLCAPFSLPLHDTEKIPLCSAEIDQACYGWIISQIQKTNHAIDCKKSCHVKEFSIKRDRRGYLPPGKINQNNQELVIEVKFDTTPQSSWKWRNLEPTKTIKTEYYIMPGLSFVGNVGGTLGMFVGFSFIGLAEWLTCSTGAFCKWLKTKLEK